MLYYGTHLTNNLSIREPEGYLLCLNVPVARTGTQEYLPEELGINIEGSYVGGRTEGGMDNSDRAEGGMGGDRKAPHIRNRDSVPLEKSSSVPLRELSLNLSLPLRRSIAAAGE